MIFEVHNNWTWVHQASDDESFQILKALSIDTSGIVRGKYMDKDGHERFGPHWKKMSWSGYDSTNRRFPSGNLWKVLKEADILNYQVIDARINQLKPLDQSLEEICRILGIDPRDYQFESVSYVHHNQRGIIEIATNGGKTEVMAMILLSYPSVCTLIICPSLTGLTEVAERFVKRGLPYNVIDAAHKSPNLEGINICSLDSLANLSGLDELLAKTQILMWDECDDSATASIGWDIAMKCNAFVRLYLSGTPFTDSPIHNQRVIGISGERAVRISNRYLIDRGYSAKPTFYFCSSQAKPIPAESSSYPVAKKRWINTDPVFANRVCQNVLAHRSEGVVVLFEERVHGMMLFKFFQSRGLLVTYIDGGASMVQRDQAKRMLMEGTVEVIVASSIWNRALDFGFPQHWHMVGGMKATNRVKQKWGRGFRKKPNEENRVWIWEYYIFGNKALEEHSQRRYQIAIEEKFEEFIVIKDSFLLPHLKKRFKKRITVPIGTTPEERMRNFLK